MLQQVLFITAPIVCCDVSRESLLSAFLNGWNAARLLLCRGCGALCSARCLPVRALVWEVRKGEPVSHTLEHLGVGAGPEKVIG